MKYTLQVIQISIDEEHLKIIYMKELPTSFIYNKNWNTEKRIAL